MEAPNVLSNWRMKFVYCTDVVRLSDSLLLEVSLWIRFSHLHTVASFSILFLYVVHTDILYGECMRNILAAVDYNDLVKLLEKSQDEALSCTAGVDEDASGMLL